MATDQTNEQTPSRPALDTSRLARGVIAAGLAVGILVLFPLTPDPAIDPKYLVLAWFAVAAAILCVKSGTSRLDPARGLSLPTAMAGLFLAIYLAACVWSRSPGASLMEAGRWTVGFGLFFLATRLYSDPAHVRRLMIVIAASVCAASVYGFIQKAGLDPFPWGTRNVEEYRGLPATFGNPNVASHALVLAIILAIALASRKGAWKYALFVAPLLLHLYWTRTRGSTVALIVGVAVLIAVRLLSGMHPRPVRRAVTVVLCAGCAGALLVVAGMAVTRARSDAYLPSDGTALIRYHSYYDACRLVGERPVTGFGPLQYRIEAPRLWTPYEQQRFATVQRTPYQVHNDWLETAVETGLIGALLYVGFIVSAFMYCLVTAFSSPDLDRRRLACAGAACLAVFAVDGLFGFPARVPVSRTIVLVVTGAILGVCVPPTRPTLRPLGSMLPPVLALAILLAAMLETRVFVARIAYQAGRNAESEELWEGAQRMYAKSAALCPWDWRIHTDLAAVRLRLGYYHEALTEYTAGLDLHPYHPSLWVGAGRADLSLLARDGYGAFGADERLEHADTAGRRALEICGVLPGAHELLARVWYARAQWPASDNETAADRKSALDQAVQHAESALAYGYEDRATLLRILAAIQSARGDEDAAFKALLRSIETDPDDVETWRLLVQLTEAHNRYPVLIAALNRRLDAEDTSQESADDELHAGLCAWLGWACAKSGEADRATAAFEKALSSAPDRLDLWYELARGVASSPATLGETLAATARSLADRDVEAPVVVRALADACLNTGPGRPSALMAVTAAFRARVAEVSRDAAVREYLWIANAIRNLMGQPDMAPADTAVAWFNLASMYEIMERPNEAADGYSRAFPILARDDQQRAALVAWVRALGAAERYAECLKVLGAHQDRWPDDVHLRYSKGRALIETGQAEEGLAIIQELLDDPNLEDQSRQQLLKEQQAITMRPLPETGTIHE